ncbi:hypothetical protein N9Z25_06755 [Luminiphilus sp.]|nr:hypothetical protein [Luminiphilus sp.]
MNHILIKSAIICALLTYSIFPGKQIFQAAAVLLLIFSSTLILGSRSHRFRWPELGLLAFFFSTWIIALIRFINSDFLDLITRIPWNVILYPFTFFCAILVGKVINKNMATYHRFFDVLFWVISFGAIVAYLFPDLPLCNGTRPMMVLPGDAACGFIDNPNYYSFTALVLFFWKKITAGYTVKGEKSAKLRAIDWDLLSLLGSSRMGLVVLMAQKSLIVKNWRTRIKFLFAGMLLLAMIYIFSPSRLDFTIDERLGMWNFAWLFILQHPAGVFSPEIYSNAMYAAIGVNGEFQNSLFGMTVIFGYLGLMLYLVCIIYAFTRIRRISGEQRVWALGILMLFVLNGIVRTHLPGGVGLISLSFGLLCGFVVQQESVISRRLNFRD